MPRYRSALPQLDGTVFLTDGGMETCLIYLDGIDLPCFAAFPLVADETGRNQLRRYFEPYVRTANEHGVGFILDTPTWRANADWAARLGYAAPTLAEVNRGAAGWAAGLRDALATERTPIVINGVVGPRGDGYRADARMTADDAEHYHAAQIGAFADTEVDMVSALTMSYVEEAIGAVRAAQARGLPVVISFTVETDGRLPSQQALPDAIEQVDRATDSGPAYYMVNCAHPTHFADVLQAGVPWLDRVRGIRANASNRSHAELDAATELDAGNPTELGEQYRALRGQLPQLSVLGGCCGTDHRHVAAICEACLRP